MFLASHGTVQEDSHTSAGTGFESAISTSGAVAVSPFWRGVGGGASTCSMGCAGTGEGSDMVIYQGFP
jgi:hypothetical protein